MDNIKLLKFCKNNLEDFLEESYIFIEKDNNLIKHVEKTKVIKSKLFAIKEILNRRGADKILEKLFSELKHELKEYSNYSEFGAFVNACDAKIEWVFKNQNLLKRITILYLKYRDLTNVTPQEWVQAVIDKGSSRKKGYVGEDKLVEILKKNGFENLKKIDDFIKSKKSFTKFSSSGDFSNYNIKKFFGIKIGKNTQNKKLDLIIKNNNQIYFLEAKHINTGGGAQNKQILEQIGIIRENPSKKNCHFVAFTDGVYSNDLLLIGNIKNKDQRKNKITNQYNDVIEALNKNKQNYWVNTAGFKKLFDI